MPENLKEWAVVITAASTAGAAFGGVLAKLWQEHLKYHTQRDALEARMARYQVTVDRSYRDQLLRDIEALKTELREQDQRHQEAMAEHYRLLVRHAQLEARYERLQEELKSSMGPSSRRDSSQGKGPAAMPEP